LLQEGDDDLERSKNHNSSEHEVVVATPRRRSVIATPSSLATVAAPQLDLQTQETENSLDTFLRRE
jgi:hypothetical protein